MRDLQAERALDDVMQAIRFLSPRVATEVLERALEEQKQAVRAYERALVG